MGSSFLACKLCYYYYCPAEAQEKDQRADRSSRVSVGRNSMAFHFKGRPAGKGPYYLASPPLGERRPDHEGLLIALPRTQKATLSQPASPPPALFLQRLKNHQTTVLYHRPEKLGGQKKRIEWFA